MKPVEQIDNVSARLTGFSVVVVIAAFHTSLSALNFMR